MIQSLRHLDRILRGESTRMAALREGNIDLPVPGLIGVIIVLGMLYGACMGCFGIVSGREGAWLQVIASMFKVPALFLFTLVVTFPSLYVFNALVGSQLTISSLLKLIIATLSVMLALLASFGTIVAFFSFTTTSYSFMVLLNVVIFAVSGFLGLSFLLQTLHRLTVALMERDGLVPPPLPPAPPAVDPSTQQEVRDPHRLLEPPPGSAGALERLRDRQMGSNVKTVFRVWVVVFGLVGAQMSWVLRPFIGSGEKFVWFRERQSNFFESVVNHLSQLLGS